MYQQARTSPPLITNSIVRIDPPFVKSEGRIQMDAAFAFIAAIFSAKINSLRSLLQLRAVVQLCLSHTSRVGSLGVGSPIGIGSG